MKIDHYRIAKTVLNNEKPSCFLYINIFSKIAEKYELIVMCPKNCQKLTLGSYELMIL